MLSSLCCSLPLLLPLHSVFSSPNPFHLSNLSQKEAFSRKPALISWQRMLCLAFESRAPELACSCGVGHSLLCAGLGCVGHSSFCPGTGPRI